MPTLPPDIPDWKDGAAYVPLLSAERACFAWEWLRRDREYREAALEALAGGGGPSRLRREQPEAGRWGLHELEDPRLAAPAARPVWRREAHPLVLVAEAERCVSGPEALDLADWGAIVTIVRGACDHLLLSDGLRSLRLDVSGAGLETTPVRLHYRIAGFLAADAPLLVLRRLLALQRTGRFSRTLHPAEVRARRLILMLRAHDALASGARQREIAARLLNGEAAAQGWRLRSPYLRSRVQRLVRSAAAMAAGGWQSLLRP